MSAARPPNRLATVQRVARCSAVLAGLAGLQMAGNLVAAAGPGNLPISGLPDGSSLTTFTTTTVATQTVLWAGQSRLWWGLGVQQRVPSLLPALPGSLANGDAGLLVGLGLDAGSSTRLTWQTPLVRADGIDLRGLPRQLRVGLVFTLRDPYADLRRGMLTKIELSGQTAVALRSRGGRLGLTLTSQW